MFHLVLHEPEIPHNAGAAGRLCLATGSTLHLIRPLGFSLEDKQVRRAGLDYWKDVEVQVWDCLEDLQNAADSSARFWMITTKGGTSYWETDYQAGDYFILGCESRGLPESLLAQNKQRLLRIPMLPGSTRSLNLSTAAALVLYEAVRQQHAGGPDLAPS
jgi:tRNA (cytidine/uridine-2'-O-)-methyltransferase